MDLCAVVSPDPAVSGYRRRRRGPCRCGSRVSGLNPGLEEGRAWALRRRADALLVVLGDLPLLTPADVAGLVAQATPPPVVVLAPDRHGTGSNALLLDSARRRSRSASAWKRRRAHGGGRPTRPALAALCTSGTAFDVDTPADLQTWLATGIAGLAGRHPMSTAAKLRIFGLGECPMCSRAWTCPR